MRSFHGSHPTAAQSSRRAHLMISGHRYRSSCRHAPAVDATFQSMPDASRVVANQRTRMAAAMLLPNPCGPRTATRLRFGTAAKISRW